MLKHPHVSREDQKDRKDESKGIHSSVIAFTTALDPAALWGQMASSMEFPWTLYPQQDFRGGALVVHRVAAVRGSSFHWAQLGTTKKLKPHIFW